MALVIPSNTPVRTLKTLHEYQIHDAPELQKDHAEKFSGKFAAFRTLMEVVDQNEKRTSR